MGVIEYGDGRGIVFTEKRIVCDTRGMSPKAIDHLVGMHERWKSEKATERAERREKFRGYVNRTVEYVKSYFQ